MTASVCHSTVTGLINISVPLTLNDLVPAVLSMTDIKLIVKHIPAHMRTLITVQLCGRLRAVLGAELPHREPQA